ncbi:MAG TPA: hypothetical protein VJP81_05460 [Candidatus Dormibacteraeota bacterium]|nr:hypothetical protein [Candidatus Dormibacteraeota bacterium]
MSATGALALKLVSTPVLVGAARLTGRWLVVQGASLMTGGRLGFA